MSQSGYYRYPTIHKDKVVFVSEDDLWMVPLEGGTAIRLTSNLNSITAPLFSPDGQFIAYIGREDGNPEVYIMPANGGISRRLTFADNLRPVICCWTQDSKNIVYSSASNQPFWRMKQFSSVSIEGGLPAPLNIGIGQSLSFGSDGRSVLGRNTGDIAYWKRYRGGTTGKIWIDAKGDGQYKLLEEPANSNFAAPLWIGERIFFTSDHEGIGNIYSVDPEGNDLQQHTFHKEYYVRNARNYEHLIVYHAGGNIFVLDTEKNETRQLDIIYNSPKIQCQRKYVDPRKYLQGYDIHPQGHSLLINTRGKAFMMGNWEGPVHALNNKDGVRKRLLHYFHNGDQYAMVSDEGGLEAIEIYSEDKQTTTKIGQLDIGRAIDIKVSPDDRFITLTNHRYELILVDIEAQTAKVVDKSGYDRIGGFNWSKDSQWLAWSSTVSPQSAVIKVMHVESGETHHITSGDFVDRDPVFDPKGNYLFFISHRIFNPVYDKHYFDVNFPKGMRPYLVALRKDVVNPFIPVPKTPGEEEDFPKSNGKDKKVATVEIDFDNIQKRIVHFPVKEGEYRQIKAIADKVLYTFYPVTGSMDTNIYSNNQEVHGVLMSYDLEKQEEKEVARSVSNFKISTKSETLVYRSGNKLCVQPIRPGIDKKAQKKRGFNRENGWIDLNRIRVSVVPSMEWRQIFDEIWRLQKQHFWVENMSFVDWDKVYRRYHTLIDKISSRGELSDLAWEMQGELGTSHAYEIGGDYRKGPQYFQGLLACDFKYDETETAYQVTHVVGGDQWANNYTSPLSRLGVNINVGDWVTAVNGEQVSKQVTPNMLLVNLVNQEINITIKDQKTKEKRTVAIKTIGREQKARYREWVERNRKYVHEKTNGKVGYVHVPNMGPEGYAEFHRYYAIESHREALIVDVRYNGGGHVSQLILEKLARKRIGYDLARWGEYVYPYPSHSVLGPIVALTNEYAGSDGDIFSHCFKLMNLGKLVGKRTWGGVIGIWPRHHLIDGGVTTQPEFSFWFYDVGFGVENYGTLPDISIDIKPQDWAADIDPQLDKAIEEITTELTNNPPQIPDFGPIPDLSLPS